MKTSKGEVLLYPHVVVLAVGGAQLAASRLRDGRWTKAVSEAATAVRPLAPSNCRLRIARPALFPDCFARPLKRIAITHQDRTMEGEA